MPLHCARRSTIVLLLLAGPGLAVTTFPSNTEPRAYNHADLPSAVSIFQDIFHQSCPNEFASYDNATVLFSGSSTPLSNGLVYSTSDGFVRGAIDAWAQHQHLVLRPEEVWFSILAQMNLYMGNNAQALRGLFVGHAGKKEIHVTHNDWESVLAQFGYEIQARVKTDWLLNWITPNFTTSTSTDVLTANVLMMGLMKAYFDYSGSIVCGLPSVTLLGEKSDWMDLLAKLDHLPDFGVEPAKYAAQLRPVLSRFVQTFGTPDNPEIRLFWRSILYAEQDSHLCGAPPFYLSGWLMGFFFWDRDGNPLHSSSLMSGALSIDGIKYAVRGIDDLPMGYAQAPFNMIDFRGIHKFPAYVLAGNIGKQISQGLPEGYAEALMRFNGSLVDESLPHGTLQPLSGWMIYGPAPPSSSGSASSAEGDEIGHLSLSLERSFTGQGISPAEPGTQRPIVIGETKSGKEDAPRWFGTGFF